MFSSSARTGVLTIALLIWISPIVRASEWEFPQDWFAHHNESERARHEALIGKPAPLLDLSEWKNQDMQAGSVHGKIVVIDFWATWCKPCLKEIPQNNDLYEKYKDQGVEVIGVCSSNRGQEKFDEVVKDKQIKYPVARDKDRKSESAWIVMWFPMYAVVDRNGIVRAIGVKPEYVEKVVEKILKEQPGPKKSSKHSK